MYLNLIDIEYNGNAIFMKTDLFCTGFIETLSSYDQLMVFASTIDWKEIEENLDKNYNLNSLTVPMAQPFNSSLGCIPKDIID